MTVGGGGGGGTERLAVSAVKLVRTLLAALNVAVLGLARGQLDT